MAKMNLEAPVLAVSLEGVRIGQVESWQIQTQHECWDRDNITLEQEIGVKEYQTWVDK